MTGGVLAFVNGLCKSPGAWERPPLICEPSSNKIERAFLPSAYVLNAITNHPAMQKNGPYGIAAFNAKRRCAMS